MKKSYVFVILFLFFIITISLVGGILVSGSTQIREEKDIFLVQSNKEVYFNVYGYDIDNPNIIVNPYGNSPLTALIMFETDGYVEVEVIVKSKNGNSDISYKLNKDKYHMIPIYGLYADYDNTIVIKVNDYEKYFNIKTEKLPSDFVYISESYNDNFIFYNSNYPYAIDVDGNVRWFLNKKYYGNITLTEDSTIFIGSDRYNEEGNTISFYKMNLLGKIYNEYLLKDGYYGYNTIYDDNLLVLSDKIILVDIQNGKVIYEYLKNIDYDYLDVINDDIIVGRNGYFYKFANNSLNEINHSNLCTKYSFHGSNYRIIPSERFGNLSPTPVSDKKITLINYSNIENIENISILKENNRIKVINNSGNKIYLILDKFMDKRVYEVDNIKYINMNDLDGRYTIYLKKNNNIYKTEYYVEV